jgi:hypothetical protein
MPVMPISMSLTTAAAPAKPFRRNILLQVIDAIGEANRRKAEREIARFYARSARFAAEGQSPTISK